MDRDDTKTQPAFPLRPLPMPLPKRPLDPAVEMGIDKLAELLADKLSKDRLRAILTQVARDSKMTVGEVESLVIEHETGLIAIERGLRDWVENH